jgi:lysozyme
MAARVSPRTIAVGLAGVLALAAPLVTKWEGVRYYAYPDPATHGAPWTVCYGHTGPDVVQGRAYTKAECDALLDADMAEADAIVRHCIPVPMLRHVEAALVSATFNLGARVVCGSAVQRKALANDWPGACEALSQFNHAGGRVMRGLTLRRADERAMCLGEG